MNKQSPFFRESSQPKLHKLTNEIGGNFDLHVYVKHSDDYPWGISTIGTVCNKTGYNFNFNQAYGPNQCHAFQSTFDCTPTNRLLLTAEVFCGIHNNENKKLIMIFIQVII